MSQLCPTLNSVVLQRVDFDPTNLEHLEAFKMLCLGTQGVKGPTLRQHPSLRFKVPLPFQDVRTMMFHRVAAHHMESIVAHHNAFA